MLITIVLSGVGGQGLISTGELIGKAASIHENIFATLTSSYGSEARGTFTKSDIIVSTESISYPNIETPDIILCLAQVAHDHYINKIQEHTLVFFDSEKVNPGDSVKGIHIGYNFRKMGIQMGNAAVANTIALGLIIEKTGVLRYESIAAAIRDHFSAKPELVEINVKALDYGRSLA